MSYPGYFLITLLAIITFFSCKENSNPSTENKSGEEVRLDKGQMFIRDDLSFVRHLKVEVPIGEIDQVLLSENFELMEVDGSLYTYRKKNDIWDMTIGITVPEQTSSIFNIDMKIAGVNNRVSNDDIYDTIAILFTESYGEAIHSGTGVMDGDKYVEYQKYDDTGGISHRLSIESGQVEVNIQAFSF